MARQKPNPQKRIESITKHDDTQESVSSFHNTDRNEILGNFSGQTSLEWYGAKPEK